MSILKKILIALIILIICLLAAGFLLPSKSTVERSTVINAPAEKVFDYVNDLEKNKLWDPWQKADPSLKTTMGKKTRGEGASYSWTSKNSGEGSVTIQKSIPNASIATLLDFKDQGKGHGSWTFKKTDNGIRVIQKFESDAGMNPVGRYFGLFLDSMIGGYFEKGLSKLKEISEK